MVNVNVALFIDKDLYDAFRKAIPPRKVSHELEDLMRKSLADLGQPVASPGQDPAAVVTFEVVA